MNSPIPTQTLIHRLILTSAAFLIYADGALAAGFGGDAQMQAKALLTATSGARPNAVDNRITPPTDGHQMFTIDAQEQARQLLSGTSNLARTTSRPMSADSKKGTKSAVSARDNPVYVDASESARRMILGIRG
jgi:hypothetical protein